MNNRICCYCKLYPCYKTEMIDKFIKAMECGVKISLNGCSDFKEA